MSTPGDGNPISALPLAIPVAFMLALPVVTLVQYHRKGEWFEFDSDTVLDFIQSMEPISDRVA